MRIFLLALLFAASQVSAFELKKEYQEEPGIAFCTSQEVAVRVIETHAVQGLEKAQEVFAGGQCGQIPISVRITYQRLIHEAEADGAKVYVYSASIRGTTMNYPVFVLLPTRHEGK